MTTLRNKKHRGYGYKINPTTGTCWRMSHQNVWVKYATEAELKAQIDAWADHWDAQRATW